MRKTPLMFVNYGSEGVAVRRGLAPLLFLLAFSDLSPAVAALILARAGFRRARPFSSLLAGAARSSSSDTALWNVRHLLGACLELLARDGRLGLGFALDSWVEAVACGVAPGWPKSRRVAVG